MKKLFAIAVVFLFLLHFVGVYTYFCVRMTSIHREMKAKLKALPEEKLEKIILSKNDLAKINFDEDEVELNGKMYDVSKVVEYNDHFIIYALHDQSEDSLLSFLDDLVNESAHDNKPVPNQLLKFFSLVFIQPQNNFFFHLGSYPKHLFSYSDLYFFIHSSIESPPPQV
jgi:hypothetical protein